MFRSRRMFEWRRAEVYFFFLASLAFSSDTLFASTVIYVDHSALGSNDGTSWADAFTDLQSALDRVSPGGEVWVAEGVYQPSHFASEVDDVRDSRFIMPDQIKLIGGFLGFESSPQERQGSRDRTILSGERGSPQREDNFRQVLEFKAGDFPRETWIESFTIENSFNEAGSGGLIAGDFEGSNLFGAPLFLRDLKFRNNYGMNGGAFFVQFWTGRMYDCVFEHNQAHGNGGAVMVNAFRGAGVGFVRTDFFNNSSGLGGGALYIAGGTTDYRNLEIVNSRFINNRALARGGALAYSAHGGDGNYLRYLRINSSLFSRNTARHGGAVWASGRMDLSNAHILESHLQVSNSTIVNNRAEIGAAFYLQGSSVPAQLTILGSILWNNFSETTSDASIYILDDHYFQMYFSAYQLSEPSAQGFSNFQETPLFVNPENEDYRLKLQSSLRNQVPPDLWMYDSLDQDNDGFSDEWLETDVLGNSRMTADGFIDIGAFESFGGVPQRGQPKL